MNNLVEYLENIQKTKGSETAVSAADGSYTFNELRCAALKTACHIADSGISKRNIAIYLPRGAKAVCAMLGVLYSGNTYVPVDHRSPINRVKLIIDIVSPAIIITDGKLRQALIGSGADASIIADFDNLQLQSNAGTDAQEKLAAAVIETSCDVDPAYILFTSGSTGVPKGVVIPHRRVINYTGWAAKHFSLTDTDVIGNQAPFYFTVSAMDIYLCMSLGLRLEIIPENLFPQPAALLEYLDSKGVSVIFWVSSVYRHIASSGALSAYKPAALKHAWFVGEPMPAGVLAHWMDKLPDVSFTNMYGSTETDMTICYTIPKGKVFENSVPLGCPCTNTDVLLIRTDKVPAAVCNDGEVGEICIRGSCLALGYYNDFEKTRASFIQNPLHDNYPDIIYRTGDLGEIKDGLILFHGRTDHQFKHLGYRIEAGEIEAFAEKQSGVDSACCLYDNTSRQIVLLYKTGAVQEQSAIRAAGNASGEPEELRRVLMAHLPVYMVPTRYIKLDEMPYNANKKKDRMALAKRYIESSKKNDN